MRVLHGDCLDMLATLDAASIDACVTDPPYGLSFMGKGWDHGVPGVDYWRAVHRVLKPGAHLLAFGGTRTVHRLVCAIEDAGFEVRDQIAWVYGSGFPKSLDVSKAIDKAAGAERERVGVKRVSCGTGEAFGKSVGNRGAAIDIAVTAPATDAAKQWAGFGTALKPAMEPICVARRPLDGTVAANVLRHGTGALNIDGCRIAAYDNTTKERTAGARSREHYRTGTSVGGPLPTETGRWPANLIHDGSDQVVALFPETESGLMVGGTSRSSRSVCYGQMPGVATLSDTYADAGSAARFFYTAKADSTERNGSKHPTVKPLDLMRYLVRLVTPPGGLVLDPFAGTGTTGQAALMEGMRAVLIEREAEYVADIERRLSGTQLGLTPVEATA